MEDSALGTDRRELVRADGLGHRYGGKIVFDNLRFSFGLERVGLLGVNGAGKSTLLRILSTGMAPSYGDIEFPEFAGSLSDIRAHIGFMPQSLAIPKGTRVGDFLAYVAWLRRVPRRQREGVVGRALEHTGLSARRDERVGALSGGMLRRLLLAQAILTEPALLLLDEPTAGLDPQQRIQFRQLIREQSWAQCVIVSSHSFEDLAPIVDRAIVLHDGRFAYDGSLDGLSEPGAGREDRDSGLTDLERAFLRIVQQGQAPDA